MIDYRYNVVESQPIEVEGRNLWAGNRVLSEHIFLDERSAAEWMVKNSPRPGANFSLTKEVRKEYKVHYWEKVGL
jgi:hypothetical protein